MNANANDSSDAFLEKVSVSVSNVYAYINTYIYIQDSRCYNLTKQHCKMPRM